MVGLLFLHGFLFGYAAMPVGCRVSDFGSRPVNPHFFHLPS